MTAVWIALAATGAPSVATVLVALIISRHRKWADEKASKAAKEAMKHHHVWGMWEEQETADWGHRFAPNVVVDTRTEYRRRCDVCGDVEFKLWSERNRGWV